MLRIHVLVSRELTVCSLVYSVARNSYCHGNGWQPEGGTRQQYKENQTIIRKSAPLYIIRFYWDPAKRKHGAALSTPLQVQRAALLLNRSEGILGTKYT